MRNVSFTKKSENVVCEMVAILSRERWVETFIQNLCFVSLQWRHNELESVSNHQPYDCLFNCLFRRRSKKTSKLSVTGLCAGNSPVTGEFPHKGPVTRKMFPFDDVIMLQCIGDWGHDDLRRGMKRFPYYCPFVKESHCSTLWTWLKRKYVIRPNVCQWLHQNFYWQLTVK